MWNIRLVGDRSVMQQRQVWWWRELIQWAWKQGCVIAFEYFP